ncbi:N-acetylneuraminate synthase [Paenibacillus wynnii]|uniref:N-acetylneuraminate synthase n=1 Tax=Paenibacillus wynnii TaxID=268407 RepID=UPI00278FFB77|nr:N-acetylneuraminate synthase [Paenibacillus wynnii]MDQ0194832.1 N-acetylneuraminate synthase [Paenibacillus wynnii]
MTPLDRVYVIAEAGVNHNGSLSLAKQLIDAAAESGADAVKFQSFKAEQLVTAYAPKADYQNKRTRESESQLAMLKRLELDVKATSELAAHAKTKKIDFFSSLFDLESVELALRLDFPWMKIPSGEITNAPLLLQASRTGKPVILSTGMSNLGDIEKALGVLAFGYLHMESPPSLAAFEQAYSSNTGQRILQENVRLLHCTTEYPAPFGEVHLRAIDVMREAFSLPVGYSDHTTGIAVSIAAAARGAVILEKHFTLDRTLQGPDHAASVEPCELKLMITSIREVEEALGSKIKTTTPSEGRNKSIARKSLIASVDIAAGTLFTEVNLTCKRPGIGISPFYLWDWLGKPAERDYRKDDVIE